MKLGRKAAPEARHEMGLGESIAAAGRRKKGLRAAIKPVAAASLAVVALVGASCAKITPSTKFQVQYDTAKAQGTVPWFCVSQGVGSTMDQAHPDGSGMANNYYAGKAKGTLSSADCLAATQFFDKAYASAMRYPTRGAAKKAGSNQSVQFVPGLGTHDSIPGVTSTGFDPAKPMFLQYDGMGDDAKLAGMSWFVMNNNTTVPPAGLPGNNDWWHTHSSLCYSKIGTVIGNEIDDATCTAAGGTNMKLPGAWMLHAWILPGYEDKYDVFAGAYMCVKGTGPVADSDPCHNDRSDPEHGGTTPTTVTPGTPTTTMPPMDHNR